MANFLITSPSSETVGTNSNDLFVLQAIQGVSLFGLEGNDTVSSIDLAGSAALLNAGAGNDSITLTASTNASLFQGSVFAGAGNDKITADQLFSAAVLRGGSGNDTIILQAAAGNILSKSTINGNDNSDLIQGTVLTGSNSSVIAAGKGKDTINLIFSGANAFTINGGAGHDSISLSASTLSSVVVAGGDGFDTITFSASAAAAIGSNSNINGDALSDLLVFNGDVATTVGSATIGGGAGADTIQFVNSVGLSQGYINAGAGLDSIYISADFSAGTLNGGAGQDSITLATYNKSGVNSGIIFGDSGADSISLGTKGAFNLASGTTYVNSGGSTLGYASFDQSNLAAYDNVSAGVSFTNSLGSGGAGTQSLFGIRQDVVDATVASSISLSTVTSNGGGFATFTSTFSNLLTARVVELDRVLAAGQSVIFQNGAGTESFVFMQGGAAGSGTDGDLLVQVNTNANSLSANSVSALSVNLTATFA